MGVTGIARDRLGVGVGVGVVVLLPNGLRFFPRRGSQKSRGAEQS